MIRKIIEIDREKCNGCGACAEACHEGAIAMIDGKAKLIRDDYCDGLGDCLPTCPTGAITFVQREAAAYDEALVKARMAKDAAAGDGVGAERCAAAGDGVDAERCTAEGDGVGAERECSESSQSLLSNWPVQIKLAPLRAPYFDGANLLVAADCTAYAYASFHKDFIKSRTTLIGCPKLDAVNYAEKLKEIFAQNDIASVTVVRMEVPCCGGLEMAVKNALTESGKRIPSQVVTISTEGAIL